MTEKRIRSLAKGISWRIIATLTTFLLAVVIFHEDPNVLMKAGTVAGLEFGLKLLIYYLHERAWLSIHWGIKE
jgi:uncharacterized membrane protein